MDTLLNVVEMFRSLDAPRRIIECVGSLSPGLAVTSSVAAIADGNVVASRDDLDAIASLAQDGYAELKDAAPNEALRGALIAAIGRLIEAGLPAVFIYLVDEVWSIGEALRARVSTLLGAPYVLKEDGWAWLVAPGQAGWTAHRDDDQLCDRKAPERVNVWVALTDVTPERACIHVVPLDDDPDYPTMNESATPPLQAVRALPVAAGTGLVWNANLLHWGGACSERAVGPRVAVSFTLLRADADARFRSRTMQVDKLDPTSRVDVIADMIGGYEVKAPPDVSPEIFRWAKATSALRGHGVFAKSRTKERSPSR